MSLLSYLHFKKFLYFFKVIDFFYDLQIQLTLSGTEYIYWFFFNVYILLLFINQYGQRNNSLCAEKLNKIIFTMITISIVYICINSVTAVLAVESFK